MPTAEHTGLIARNLAANVIGSVWAVVLSLVSVPIFIHFLGVEAYGLIGIYVSLQFLFSVLDLGLSLTLSRELARHAENKSSPGEIRNLVLTLELIYWLVAIGIGAVIVLASGFLARSWLNSSQLTNETVKDAIRMIGIIMMFQWPFALYSGGMIGLQRQVERSVFVAIMTTLRTIGAVIVVWQISRTVYGYFAWQIVVACLQAVVARKLLWKNLTETGSKAKVDLGLLRGIWRFALGTNGINLMGVLLTQLDKIILSRTLSLETFGYYAIAGSVATPISMLVASVYSAFFPRLTHVASRGDETEIKDIYHCACQTMAIVIVPVALTMAVFSREILQIWTRDSRITESIYWVMSLLVTGRLLNGFVAIPSGLQYAFGWVSLGLYTNLLSVIILVPLISYASIHYGIVGAAVAWMLLNLGYVFVAVPFMHLRLLTGEKWRWYISDLGKPVLAVACVVLSSRTLKWTSSSTIVVVMGIGLTYLCALLVCVIATDQAKRIYRQGVQFVWLQKWRGY